MNTARILTQSQAQAVYNDMCDCEEAGDIFSTKLDDGMGEIQIFETRHGLILLKADYSIAGRYTPSEVHGSQYDFATAYNLN